MSERAEQRPDLVQVQIFKRNVVVFLYVFHCGSQLIRLGTDPSSNTIRSYHNLATTIHLGLLLQCLDSKFHRYFNLPYPCKTQHPRDTSIFHMSVKCLSGRLDRLLKQDFTTRTDISWFPCISWNQLLFWSKSSCSTLFSPHRVNVCVNNRNERMNSLIQNWGRTGLQFACLFASTFFRMLQNPLAQYKAVHLSEERWQPYSANVRSTCKR